MGIHLEMMLPSNLSKKDGISVAYISENKL